MCVCSHQYLSYLSIDVPNFFNLLINVCSSSIKIFFFLELTFRTVIQINFASARNELLYSPHSPGLLFPSPPFRRRETVQLGAIFFFVSFESTHGKAASSTQKGLKQSGLRDRAGAISPYVAPERPYRRESFSSGQTAKSAISLEIIQ